MSPRICLAASLLVAVSTASLQAEVVGSAKHGFLIVIEQDVSASTTKTFKKLIDLPAWWDASHSYSGKSENLYLELKKGGWFGEKLKDGGFVKHMEVAYYKPNQSIRLLGGLGPLQEMGVDGALTMTVTKKEDAAVIKLQYSVSGFTPGGLDQLAPIVDKVLSAQVQRLSKSLR